MKKVFSIIVLTLVISVALGLYAADITQTATYSTPKPPITGHKFYDDTRSFCYKAANTDIPALVSNVNNGVAGDKYAVVGPDTTTKLMVQTGTNVCGPDGLSTQALTVAFSGAPTVVAQYNSAAGAGTNVYPSSVSSNSIVITGAADAGFNWYAIGQRP